MTKPNKGGLVLGALVAGWHVFWVLLIVLGVAQRLLDFIFWAHMIQPVYKVSAFDPKAMLILIGITFVTGYGFGYVGVLLWNKLHRA